MEKTKMFPICLGAIFLFCQGLTPDISGESLSEITPLSASIKDRIRDTDYVKPVKDYLSSHLEEENLIPVAFYFDSLSYDSAIYGAEDIGDYGRLMEKMAEKEAHLIHTNTFFVSYLLGTKNLSIEDCGKMDGERVPVWSDPSLEPFYKELNAKLIPPFRQTSALGRSLEPKG